MKNLNILSKLLPALIAVCLLLGAVPSFALDEPDIQSRSAMVVDEASGRVYYSKNADELIYPASTTKIMTVLLAIEAIERGDVSIYDTVTAGQSMNYDLVADGSSAGIRVGETMTLENLLYCAMISSANEACNVIAEHIAGSIPDFIERMNSRASELGCTYTHFSNTHGLPDENHYSTASDFALIAEEAASHELFMKICNTPSITLPATNMSGERILNNSNALICADSIYGSGYLYEYAAGIKTGYTSDAGYCLVSTASKDGIELLAVVFGGSSKAGDGGKMSYSNFEDTIKLYDWVFNNFSYRELLGSVNSIAEVSVSLSSDADSVSLRPEAALTALLPNDVTDDDIKNDIRIYSEESGEKLKAPISAGQVLGEVSVSIDGVSYGTVKLVAASSVELSHIQYLRSEVVKTLRSTPVTIAIIVIFVLLLAYIALVVRYRMIHNRRRRAAEEKRRARERAARAEASAKRSAETSASAPIDFFSDAPAQPEAPDAQPGESYPVSGGFADDPSQESAEAKADRDYFEEFFRQK